MKKHGFALFVLVALTLFCLVSGPRPASAGSHVDFFGVYSVLGASEGNIGNAPKDKSFTDNYMAHWYDLFVTFQPTDEISIHWRVHLLNDVDRFGSSQGGLQHFSKHLYATVKQEWGTVAVGRLDSMANNYGLANLGYFPQSKDWGLESVGPFDDLGNIEGIEYRRDWDSGLGLLAQFARWPNYGYSRLSRSSDYDHDIYTIEPSYKWENGGAALGLIYERNAGGDGNAQGVKTHNAVDKKEAWYLNPSFMHSFGALSLHAEAKAGWGTIDYYHATGAANAQKQTDTSGYGAYLDLTYNYDKGDLILAGWWLAGTSLEESAKPNGKSKSLVGIGSEFYPLIIAYNYNAWGYNRLASQGVDVNAAGLANSAFTNYVNHNRGTLLSGGDPALLIPGVSNGASGPTWQAIGRERWSSFNNGTDANHWGLKLSGHYALTEDIDIRAVGAYLSLNHANYKVLNKYSISNGGDFSGLGYREQSKDLGYEIDVAVAIKLLDNLDFTSTFGYMFTGDAYKSLKGYNVSEADAFGNRKAQAVWEDAKDSYGWYNTLTFLF